MRTLGIIAEYNPFHKGHRYMIEEAKRKTGATRVVAVMSGSFVQRGEPAIFDKWTRTEAALQNGVDLVLELPVLFAVSNAETFATGAVRMLEDTGLVDALCFGSESGNLTLLQEAAKLMTNETEEFQRILKENLSSGMSYAAARARALEVVSKISSQILTQPNHILGLEYLKALDRYNCHMQPITIRREGAEYHNPSLEEQFASASAIRKGLLEEEQNAAMGQVPENCQDLYNKVLSLGTAPVEWSNLEAALNFKLRTMSPEEVKDISEVTEGLENRILHAVDSAYDIEDIIQFIKTKRYTRTKIQRILLHILLDIKESEVDYFLKKNRVPYLRVLGFHKDSDLLGELSQSAKVPVLTNLKKMHDVLDADGMHLLALEKLATDLHTLASPNPLYRAPNSDFTTPMVIL